MGHRRKNPGVAYWTTVALVVLPVIYVSAYLLMMRPYLFWCRPGGGFGVATFGKPTYRLYEGGPLFGNQEAWRSFFSPAFAIHRYVDPNWMNFKFEGHVPLTNGVSEDQAFAEVDAHTAWPDKFGAIVHSNRKAYSRK